MNKIYKVVWNKSIQKYVVVPGYAKGKVKSSVKSNSSNHHNHFYFNTLSVSLLLLLSGQSADARVASGWFTDGGAEASSSSVALSGNSRQKAKALADHSVAVSTNATVDEVSTNSIAIGRNATVEKSRKSIAMGLGATILGDDDPNAKKDKYGRNIAIGENAQINDATNLDANGKLKQLKQSVALGSEAKVLGTQSTAIGNNVIAEGQSSIAIGGDDLDFVAGDTASWSNTDKPNFSNDDANTSDIARKYKGNTGQYLIDVGESTGAVDAKGHLIRHKYELENGKKKVDNNGNTIWELDQDGNPIRVDGYIETKSGEAAVAIGTQSTAKGAISTAVGTKSYADGFGAVAFGVGATARMDNSFALGAGSQTNKSAPARREQSALAQVKAYIITDFMQEQTHYPQVTKYRSVIKAMNVR